MATIEMIKDYMFIAPANLFRPAIIVPGGAAATESTVAAGSSPAGTVDSVGGSASFRFGVAMGGLGQGTRDSKCWPLVKHLNNLVKNHYTETVTDKPIVWTSIVINANTVATPHVDVLPLRRGYREAPTQPQR